ncbi:MAG TPA: hypothetical protein VKN36_00980 [Eudoraea sp.]|nr:hypothetical protein [Eudoraea sp.]
MTKESLKHLIKIVFLVLLISFLVDKIAFVALNRISDEVMSGQSLGKVNHYLKIKDDSELIVYGNSRANHHIDPSKITEKGFNMGVNGTRLAYSYGLLKLLPKEKKQILLIQIDPEHAFSEDYKGEDIELLRSKYNRNKIIKTEIKKLNQENDLQNFFWTLGYNGKVLGILKNYFRPNYDYKVYSGYDPIYVTGSQRKILENILADDKKEPCPDGLTFNHIYDLELDEIRQFSQANNKVAIFFTSPRQNDYCKDDNVKFGRIMNAKEMIYYDLTDYFKENDSIIYWKDPSHLSNIGAEIFTDAIKDIIERTEK